MDSANGTWSYKYDEMNRLCNANHSSTQPTCHQTQTATYNYGYDRFGNLWSGIGSLSISFSGNNNRIDGNSYDAAGNLLNDGVTQYTYDSESRIISAANNVTGVTASYEYDAEGRRIRKTTSNGGTVDFLYDLGGHEISQITSAGAWTRGEIYAGGRHLGTYGGGTSGNTYFTFSDWIGTERARSAPGATTACETITSNPFGDGLTTAGSCGDPSPMHLTGKERDNETGLDNFGARYNSSQYGRFMTADWSGKPQGVPYAQFGDPESLNLYVYVGDNPIGTADPDGHCALCDLFNFFFSTANDPPPSPPPPPPPGEMEEFPAQNQQSQSSAQVSVERKKYAAASEPSGAGGVDIKLLAKVKGSKYKHFNWRQTVTSNTKNSGKPFADAPPGAPPPYYYWSPQDQTHYENIAQEEGGSTYFEDFPRQPFSGTTVKWNAVLSLVGINSNGTYDTLKSFSYGFTIDANATGVQGVHLEELKELP